MHDPHCIFCKIAPVNSLGPGAGDRGQAVAFLDINPLNPGHTLVVPRSHHAQLGELPDELAAHVGSLLPRLCRAVKAATGAEGLNVMVNNGRVAGQTIDHCHWHIIPRFPDDPIHWPWPQGKYSGEELGRMQVADPHGTSA